MGLLGKQEEAAKHGWLSLGTRSGGAGAGFASDDSLVADQRAAMRFSRGKVTGKPRTKQRTKPSDPASRVVLLAVVVLCLAVSIYLSRHSTNEARTLNEHVLAVFQLGCGAIIGRNYLR